jgi:hypothetical protein
MSVARISVSVIALLIGGWLVSDGIRAFVTNDYLTARTGPRAGQLGPWAGLVAKAGIDPRSWLMKACHIALGLAWLLGLVLFITQKTAGVWLLLLSALSTLWYLPVGTALSLVELGLLFSIHFRDLK